MYESNNIQTNLLEMNRAENTAEFNENYKNILKPYMNWMGHDLNYRMDIFLRRRIQKLRTHHKHFKNYNNKMFI